MNLLRNKTAAAITVILTLTVAIALIAVPLITARVWPEPIPTWTYIGVTPAEVSGVNQELIIVFWCNFIPPTAIGEYGDRWTFWVDVTTPSGTETLGGSTGFESDPVGGAWCTYTPTEIGEYTFVARMDEATMDGGASRGKENPAGPVTWPSFLSDASIGDVFQASESEPWTITVVEEQLAYYEETPLPTDYWTRPVYGANHEWGQVMGNWLNAGDIQQRTNLYSDGPGSSHILWARPYWDGGIEGGSANVNFGPEGYYSGLSYENFGGVDFILNGRIYFSDEINPRNSWYCIDLYTGEIIYVRNNTGGPSGAGGPFASTGSVPYGDPAFGQVLSVNNPNQHGALPYFWVTSTATGNWDMYDAWSGDYICSIGNLPSFLAGGFFFGGAASVSSYGLEGSILRYAITDIAPFGSPSDYYLQCWNTSQAIHYKEVYSSNEYWMWRPGINITYDGANGYTLNASLPNGDGILEIKEGKHVITGHTTGSGAGFFGTGPLNNGTHSEPGRISAYNLDPSAGELGSLLWTFNFTAPPGLGDAALQDLQFSQHDVEYGGIDSDLGIFWYRNTMLREWYVYDLETGNQLWTSEPGPQWDFYGMNMLTYNGNLYSYGYGGVLIAYNATTGDVMWNWTAPFVGVGETAYPYTPLSLGCVADGKIYLYSSEHSPSQPLRRDAKLYCVDAESGELVWSITCWPQNPVIADGRIVTFDLFDHMLYCFGKGPSATTVESSQDVSVHGDTVMLKGTVTDQSPSGRYTSTGSIDFLLKGTPAIADESMDDWMEYMFHQRPMPMDATGVEVVLETLDPNGNFYEVGKATTDVTGQYAVAFTPEVPGMYTIIASFEGSEAYGSSFAQTYLYVEDAPVPSPTPTPSPPPATDMYVLGSTIGIIIAIVAVGLVIVLMLRRR